MHRLLAAAVSLIGFAVTVVASSGTPWPMYQGNAQHTGYVPVRLDPSRFSIKWQQPLVPNSWWLTGYDSIALAEGKAFVVLSGITKYLAALAADSGQVLWSRDLDAPFPDHVNPPGYAYGNVYVQSGSNFGNNYLRAYNAATGQLVFRTTHGTVAPYLAPTIENGTVYTPSADGITAFDAFDGSRRWYAALGRLFAWTPAADGRLTYAYPGYPGRLYALDPVTGTTVFEIPDPDYLPSVESHLFRAPTLAGNDIVVVERGRLIDFDLVNRRIRWQLQQGFGGQPSVAHGVIYALNGGSACTCGRRLSVVDQATGTVLWEWAPPGGDILVRKVIVTDSHVLVSGRDTYAVDVKTHQLAWSLPTNGLIALGEGMLYVVPPAGHLTAIDTMTPVTEPTLDVKVNGMDTVLMARQGEPVSVSVSLDPRARTGQPADWWISARAPLGTYWFTVDRGWVLSPNPLRAYDGVLMTLATYEVLPPTVLPPGRYDFSFAVDAPDGVMTGTFFKTAVLTVQ